MSGPARPPYAADIGASLALMDRLLRAYGDHPLVTLAWGPAGPQWVTDAMMAAVAVHARTNGLGIHTHALESPAQAAACRELFSDGALAWLDQHGALGEHVTLAHAVWLDDDDIARLAATGTAVVRAPGCNLRMRNGIQRTDALIRAGVRVGIGSDNVTLQDDEDLLGELRLMDALARRPDWASDDRPTVADLLAALTTDGARAAFLPGGSGRLQAGAVADIVAIDLKRTREPMLHPDMPLLRAVLARARGEDVRFVMVGGAVQWRDGRHGHLDIEDAERLAAASALSTLRPVSAILDASGAETLIDSMAGHYRRVSTPQGCGCARPGIECTDMS